MNRTAVIAALCLLVAGAGAQFLETVIPLPDTLGGVGSPSAMAYNSTANRIYAGGNHPAFIIARIRSKASVLSHGPIPSSPAAASTNATSSRLMYTAICTLGDSFRMYPYNLPF